jgi:hypothetical protein
MVDIKRNQNFRSSKLDILKIFYATQDNILNFTI